MHVRVGIDAYEEGHGLHWHEYVKRNAQQQHSYCCMYEYRHSSRVVGE